MDDLKTQQSSFQAKKNQKSCDDVWQQAEQRINSINSDPLLHQLSLPEQMEFSHICSYFQLVDDRNKRNFGMSTFIKHLNLIHHFVVKDDGGDALRGLVCGILFGNGFLLVNTDKLKKLTKRSKSCVNGCFQKLGFNVFRETQDLNAFFSKLFPNLDPALLNSRHWCIRKASEEAPICFIASTPLEVSARSGFSNETYNMMTYPNYRPLSQQQQPLQQNLTNINNNINMGCFSPPNTNLFNDQCNINMNLSINNGKSMNDGYNNIINYSNIMNTSGNQAWQQPINFQFQQQISQKKEQSDQTFRQQQFCSSSDTMDSPSEREKINIFFADIKSLLNR